VNGTSERVRVGGLSIDRKLYDFVAGEASVGLDCDLDSLWNGFGALICELGLRQRELLAVRDELQHQINAWHQEHPRLPDAAGYKSFLTRIGYIAPEPAPFTVFTAGVDPEIALMSGPQLVVPVLNPRFATNAANARWGSLYDALYGTDAITDEGDLARGSAYNPARGAEVIQFARRVLDEHVPLEQGSHDSVTQYTIVDGRLLGVFPDGTSSGLADADQLIGYTGDPREPRAVLLAHHRLHIEIVIDRQHPIGATDRAGVADVVLESAITAIMDLEDSVVAVDVDDKVECYRNWLQLMQGRLTGEVTKQGKSFIRRMNPDRRFTAPDGGEVILPGRALMLVRNVGHHMSTDMVRDADGSPIGEGMVDALITALCAMHDLRGDVELRNSRTGSVYIVKPKMHGPDEVVLTVDLFAAVEQILGLPPLTLKLGIMDEERRTSVNLAACLAAAPDRAVFINTGFLDRTGDEIHTSMLAGPMVRKADMHRQRFMTSYEEHNVDVGLAAGLPGHGQIGKGMWAMPDLMRAMMEQKSSHPRAGAATAWVPSPTAATLHALHYHEVDVDVVQKERILHPRTGIDPILELPLAPAPDWTNAERQVELDNNAQSILGYVVRWVDQGIGCSKVPDIDNVAMMEDRATLRISCQLLANWLTHGVIDDAAVEESLRRIAVIVDQQNAGDENYEPLFGNDGPGTAFLAARELIFRGGEQPNGYTEPILHRARRSVKARQVGLVSGTNAR
jgi:malate synthase